MQPNGQNNIASLPQVTPVASANSAAIPARSSSAIKSVNQKPVYPYPNDAPRLDRYNFNALLFDGNHFDAFKIKVDNEQFNKAYSRLRYIVCNFPGLISKICADMLFGQPPRISLPEGTNNDNNADWLENWLHDTDFMTTLYESAMTASYKGDTIIKLRIGILNDPDNPSVIPEQVQPDFFFPTLDPQNVTAAPSQIELSFMLQINGEPYLRKEIHTAGQIENQLFKMQGNEIIGAAPLSLLVDSNDVEGTTFQDVEKTGVNRLLVVHIPNWKDGRTYYGNDDYQDLTTLFYAINNRISKIDNVLDKHTDPILAIPEGVLDEEGKVRREHLNLFEMGEGGDKPEYVVWNAQLVSAFDEVDRLMESLYMFSEISPDAFGNLKGNAAASGRALKYRLMRTVSKIKRKQLYFDRAIKEVVYLAQLLALEHKIQALGATFTGAAEIPSIEWHDPIPQDSFEQAQEEELRLASGNQSLLNSIMNIDELDEEQAQEKLDDILAEKKKLAPPVPLVQVAAPGAPDPVNGGVPNQQAQPNGASTADPAASGTVAQSADPYGQNVITPTVGKPASAMNGQ